MKTRFFAIGIICSSALLLSFSNGGVKSNGAPIGSTGAPNEQTCAKSGCHDAANINSGSGVLIINFDDSPYEYETGKTYDITVSLQQNGINRFGYQLIALRNSDNTNIGNLAVTDSARTQIFAGSNQFTGRNYMTYKYAGTEPYSTNLGQWTFQWTAPATDEGSITLYAASVAANNDGTDSGDLVYTHSITLQPKAVGINEANKLNAISVYPNPANDYILIESGFQNSELKITGINGAAVYKSVLHSEKERIDVAAFASGIYIVEVNNDNAVYRKKIFIQ